MPQTIPLIVPEDCFLRRLPLGLALHQRMQLDAIRVAADMIGIANHRAISEAMFMCREEQLKPSRMSMTALLLDAWSVISHCHTMRQVLRSLQFNTAQTNAFIAATKVTSEIRDAQQHYHTQITNRAKKKKGTAPLYGALTWTYVKDPPPVTGLYFVTCWSGAMIEPKMAVKIAEIDTSGIRLPIGNIRLQAFDHEVDLQKVTDSVSALVQHLNTDVATMVRDGIDETAKKNSLDPAKGHAVAAADLFFALWGNVNPQ
jgi:hypothetical protein